MKFVSKVIVLFKIKPDAKPSMHMFVSKKKQGNQLNMMSDIILTIQVIRCTCSLLDVKIRYYMFIFNYPVKSGTKKLNIL